MVDPGIVLGDVNPNWVFRTSTGVIIHNIYELKNYLVTCSDADFLYHVNEDHHKNDFALWIREVVHDDKLAHELDNELAKDNYMKKIQKRLKELDDQFRKKYG